MKQNSSLPTALLIFLCTSGTLRGQHPTRHSTTHTLAHKAVACADSLDVCPPEGCGGGDPSLNRKKNVLQKPAGQPEDFTFGDFIHLESERPGPGEYTPGDRKSIEEMGEDTFVALNGYMIGAHPGSPETCNCKLSGGPSPTIGKPDGGQVWYTLPNRALNCFSPFGGRGLVS